VESATLVDHRFKNFVEPPWTAPVDVASVVRHVPESATISGMFLEPLAELGRLRSDPLPSARERYTQFRFYPLREHVNLLIETCARHYAALPMRQALRKLGRAAPGALVQSTIGRVMLNSASGVEECIRAMAKTYSLNVRPGTATPIEFGRGYGIVRLEDIHYFLDSHHVGSFEGVLKFAGVQGDVRICSYSATSADLLCTWY
jgi:uncharacterized protein (TIGR02265 family)